MTRLAGVTRGVARRLRTVTDEPIMAPDAVAGGGMSRRTQRHLARGASALHEATSLLAGDLDAIGSALQGHATALASAITQLRTLAERGEQVGLVLVDGRWQPTWGITGSADAGHAEQREDLARQWQHDHDALTRTAARRRAELVRLLQESRERMARETARLRDGF